MKNIVTQIFKNTAIFVLITFFNMGLYSQSSFKKILNTQLKRITLDDRLEVLDSAAKYFSANEVSSPLYFNQMILEDINASTNIDLQYRIINRIIVDAQNTNEKNLEQNALLKKINIAKLQNNKTTICKVYKELGDFYKKNDNSKLALVYYQKAVSSALNYKILIPEAIQSKLEEGFCYCILNQPLKANQVYNEFSMFKPYLKDYEIKHKLNLLSAKISYAFKDYPVVQEKLEKLLSSKMLDSREKTEAYLLLSKINDSVKQNNKRDEYLKKALHLSKIDGNISQIREILNQLILSSKKNKNLNLYYQSQLAQTEEMITFSSIQNNKEVEPDSALTFNIFVAKLNELNKNPHKSLSDTNFYTFLIVFLLLFYFLIVILKYNELLHYYKRITYYTQHSLTNQHQLIYENLKLKSKLNKIERTNIRQNIASSTMYNRANIVSQKNKQHFSNTLVDNLLKTEPQKYSEVKVSQQILNPLQVLKDVIEDLNTTFHKQGIKITLSKDSKIPQKLVSNLELLKKVISLTLTNIIFNSYNLSINLHLKFDRIEPEYLWINFIIQCSENLNEKIINEIINTDKQNPIQKDLQMLNGKIGYHTLLDDKMTIWINMPFRYDIKNFITKILSI